MIDGKKVPTTITSRVETPDGSSVRVIDVKTLSDDEVLKYAALGEPAALNEFKIRIQQNNRN